MRDKAMTSMGFLYGDGEGEKDLQISKGDGIAEADHGRGADFSIEFKPIEHPLEPPDEDRPLKCPFHSSEILNSRGHMRLKRSASARFERKKPEFIPVTGRKEASARLSDAAEVKGHQTVHLDCSRHQFSRTGSSRI